MDLSSGWLTFINDECNGLISIDRLVSPSRVVHSMSNRSLSTKNVVFYMCMILAVNVLAYPLNNTSPTVGIPVYRNAPVGNCQGLAVDKRGLSLFMSDTHNARVLEIDLTTGIQKRIMHIGEVSNYFRIFLILFSLYLTGSWERTSSELVFWSTWSFFVRVRHIQWPYSKIFTQYWSQCNRNNHWS